MMTQVQELDSDRHMKMTMAEFFDVIGRVADKVDLSNRTEKIEKMDAFSDEALRA